jgi:hypothetical protein
VIINVKLTDVKLDTGNMAVNLQISMEMAPGEDPNGPTSKALLAAHWFRMHFDANKVDCDLALRNLQGQAQLRDAVRAAMTNEGTTDDENASREPTAEEEAAVAKALEIHPDEGSPSSGS